MNTSSTPTPNATAPSPKSYTTHVLNGLRRDYDGRQAQATITNGRSGITLSVRYTSELQMTTLAMTPALARELAADLIARADEIEGLER